MYLNTTNRTGLGRWGLEKNTYVLSTFCRYVFHCPMKDISLINLSVLAICRLDVFTTFFKLDSSLPPLFSDLIQQVAQSKTSGSSIWKLKRQQSAGKYWFSVQLKLIEKLSRFSINHILCEAAEEVDIKWEERWFLENPSVHNVKAHIRKLEASGTNKTSRYYIMDSKQEIRWTKINAANSVAWESVVKNKLTRWQI